VTFTGLPAVRELDVSACEPQTIGPKERERANMDLFRWVAGLPLLQRLRSLRLPSVRTPANARELAQIIARAPDATIEVLRTYSRRAAGLELASDKLRFAPPWPWPPGDQLHEHWEYRMTAPREIGIDLYSAAMTSGLERVFDERDEAFRDDWRTATRERAGPDREASNGRSARAGGSSVRGTTRVFRRSHVRSNRVFGRPGRRAPRPLWLGVSLGDDRTFRARRRVRRGDSALGAQDRRDGVARSHHRASPFGAGFHDRASARATSGVELAHTALDQAAVKNAAVDLVITGDFDRLRQRYGDRSERFADLEAGHAAENVLLEGVALGLGGVTIGTIDAGPARDVLRVGKNETPLYILAMGHPAPSH
jgi:nitroreductase